MDYHMLQCLYLCSEKRDRHAHRSVYVSLVWFFLQTELSENYWIRNPCIIHSFYFRLEIKNQKTKKWQLILFFVFESITKKCLVFHISDQEYEMKKQAAGLNLILIFNWSGLRDPEVWRYQRDAVPNINSDSDHPWSWRVNHQFSYKTGHYTLFITVQSRQYDLLVKKNLTVAYIRAGAETQPLRMQGNERTFMPGVRRYSSCTTGHGDVHQAWTAFIPLQRLCLCSCTNLGYSELFFYLSLNWCFTLQLLGCSLPLWMIFVTASLWYRQTSRSCKPDQLNIKIKISPAACFSILYFWSEPKIEIWKTRHVFVFCFGFKNKISCHFFIFSFLISNWK